MTEAGQIVAAYEAAGPAVVAGTGRVRRFSRPESDDLAEAHKK
jgi:hypothetical protein